MRTVLANPPGRGLYRKRPGMPIAALTSHHGNQHLAITPDLPDSHRSDQHSD